MKWIKRLFAMIFIVLAGLIGFILLAWKKNYDVPMPALSATRDSAMIERGKYLVYGPAHCATCHMPLDKIEAVEAGEKYPLSGGWEFDIPPATLRASNLTPDEETGIGKLTDGELARAMRYSINHKGVVMLPLMPFQELSDEDVVAILSFLRSQPPVKHKVESTEYKFLGKALLAFNVLKPEGPKTTPPAMVTKDTSAAYGKYLAHSVGNCVGCHTQRDLKTGAFTGEPFAGGLYFEPDPFSAGYSFISPNLTPHEGTGRMNGWNQQLFVERFRKGRLHKGSPMPWGAFSRLDEGDLKAIYSYLSSVKPVDNMVSKIVFAPGEKPAGF